MKRSTKPLQSVAADLPERIVIDACVLLNLHATARLDEILAALPSRALVSSYVSSETLWHNAANGSGEFTARQTVVLDSLVRSGIIEIVELTVEEQEAFLVLALQLDDGEAASGAIALSRLGAVATDDRKARRVFSQHVPPIRTVGTATLLRIWEDRAAITATEIGIALRTIRMAAKFEPGPNDDGFDWWAQRSASDALK